MNNYDDEPEDLAEEKEFFQPPAEAETPGETARKTGLALSAGITLFGAVVVCMAVGYIADRYFNSSPTGLIVGIVLGSLIGFFQFFRLTSQILKK
ncbi:MAG: AtpZ/AtpI family protein [Pyrinomonadaceae bacterium]